MFRKVNEKRYQSEIDGEYVNLDVPFSKVEMLFQEFCQYLTVDGKMDIDPIQMVLSMKKVGNIILTKFGPTGEVLEAGNCSNLSTEELADLFEIGQEAVLAFVTVISKRGKKQELPIAEESSVEEKAQKALKIPKG